MNRKKRGFKIKVPPGSRYEIKTPDHAFQHHVLQLILGKRGSGKGVYCFSLVKELQKIGCAHRVILVSPTALSNAALLHSCNIDMEDVIDPEDPEAVSMLNEIVDEEADNYQQELDDMDEYDQFKKDLDNGNVNLYHINDETFLKFTDETGNLLQRPTHRYGARPFLHCILDDCQSSRIFRDRKLANLAIRHRHVGGLTYKKGDPNRKGALGLSMYFLCQNLKAQAGSCPRAVRNNSTQLVMIGKTADEKELADIYSSVAGEVSREDFDAAREYAIGENSHGCFIIDLHPKKGNSMFRKGLDEMIDLKKLKLDNNKKHETCENKNQKMQEC